jgi:hypothetical protein
MVADPGTFSGTPEALHYEHELKNPVHVPSGLLLCPRITVGTLFGLPTIVATSGEPPKTIILKRLNQPLWKNIASDLIKAC